MLMNAKTDLLVYGALNEIYIHLFYFTIFSFFFQMTSLNQSKAEVEATSHTALQIFNGSWLKI